MFDKIRADMKGYEELGGWYRHLGFWITLIYRFGNWSRGIRFWPLKMLLMVFHALAAVPVRFFRHVYIASSAEIGSGLILEHAQSILIPPGCQLGSGCTVFHEVTFGAGAKKGFPRLADHVVVFPGARVLGGISVGEHAHIGANVVILKDVAEGAYVMPSIPRHMPGSTSRRLQLADKKQEQEEAAESAQRIDENGHEGQSAES